VALAVAAGDEGITARALAVVMFDNSKSTRGEIEKARRQLDGLTADGKLRCIPGTSPGNRY
jgi:hypothetical protein